MNLNILVVEDDSDIMNSILDIISMTPHNAIGTSSAENAINQIKTQRFDVVITDYHLGYGQVTGSDVLIEAKKTNPTTDVVITSALSNIDLAVNLMKSGAFDFIRKPFRLEDIENIILRVLDKKKQIPTLEALEKEHIMYVLSQSPTYEVAAKILGINMATLWRKRKAYSIR